jgi:hypothetical protein
MTKHLIRISALGLLALTAYGLSNCTKRTSTPEYEIFESKDLASVQTTYFGTFTDKPGWPPMPRRDQIWDSSSFKNGTVSLGIKIPAFGAEIGSTTKLKFDVIRRNRVWILMHTPTMTEKMCNQDEAGTYHLNAREEYNMVAICMFSAHLMTDARTSAGISFIGTGAEGEAGLTEETSISQMSEFYPVKMGETIKDWFKKCDEVFDAKVRASMEQEFDAISANMRYQVKQEQCVVPELESDKYLSDGRAGDRSCEKFFRSLLPGIEAHYTTRCIPQAGLPQNVGFCKVRSPEKQNCVLYKSKDGSVGERYTEGASLVSGPFSYPCDKTKGLTCKVVKEGGWFKSWSEIYRDYEGACVK